MIPTSPPRTRVARLVHHWSHSTEGVLRRHAASSLRKESQAVESSSSWDCTHVAKEEDRYLSNMVLMLLGVLVLPALLMMAYLIFNPTAFQTESFVR